jgi:hypothetical protein
LAHLADKYGAKALLDTIDLDSLRAAIALEPPKLFGFAISHGQIETARGALALFQKDYRVAPQYSYKTAPQQGYMSGDKPYLLTDIPRDYLDRIPSQILFDLMSAQERVLLYGATWAAEAKKIKVRQRPGVGMTMSQLTLVTVRSVASSPEIPTTVAHAHQFSLIPSPSCPSITTYAHVSNFTESSREK